VPNEVYLTGEMNAFVADRGGMLRFGSRRIMGLSLPLLTVLTFPEFRAVLAQEFAHF
jgi:Zn-dependent protease with chaperone function